MTLQFWFRRSTLKKETLIGTARPFIVVM